MKLFTKVSENFVCGQCGNEVRGSGYTNHCPKCLWSKHVDNNPGDRGNDCLGLMETVGIRTKDGQTDILHRCQICKIEKWNKVTNDDDADIIVKLSTNPV